MDASRSELLGELASDAALERNDFLVSATDQLRAVHRRQRRPDPALGGLTLIDDDPDFLSVAPDLTFRSRSRYLDDATGEWVSETEVIESAAELVELYNPADVYAAFAEAAREAAGLAPSRPAAEDLLEVARICRRRMPSRSTTPTPRRPTSGRPVRAGWPSPRTRRPRPSGCTTWPCRSRSAASGPRPGSSTSSRTSRRALSEKLGDVIVVDDDDERLMLKAGEGLPRPRSSRTTRTASGGTSSAPTRSSSSTTRPTSSATWPTRWPRPSRQSLRSRPGRRRRPTPMPTTTPTPRSEDDDDGDDAADADATDRRAEVTTDADATGDRDRA